MSKIDSYNTYQNVYDTQLLSQRTSTVKTEAAKTTPNGWESDPVKVEHSAKTEKKQTTELSERAQKLLEELKAKYSNMDFVIADYSSEEEAKQLLSRGTKEYSVLMDPATLEKMAEDDEVKAQYMDIIDQSTAKLDDMKEELKDSGQDVKRIGFSVDENGQVSYFAELEKASKAQSERLEEKRAEKKEEQKKAKKDETEKQQKAKKDETEKQQKELVKERTEERYGISQDSVKRVTLTAGTTEELLEKIRNVDWNRIPDIALQEAGKRFDFSV